MESIFWLRGSRQRADGALGSEKAGQRIGRRPSERQSSLTSVNARADGVAVIGFNRGRAASQRPENNNRSDNSENSTHVIFLSVSSYSQSRAQVIASAPAKTLGGKLFR